LRRDGRNRCLITDYVGLVRIKLEELAA
jgi:hypothetical protein